MDFILIRAQAGFSKKRLAQYLDVTPQTVRNWDKGSTKPPTAVLKLLSILSKDLEFLGSEWTGFRFWKNEIITPEGDYLRPSDLRANRWTRKALDFYQEREKKKRFSGGSFDLIDIETRRQKRSTD
jgi:transcriptional regulator with XRE-family HTH domain